MTKRRRVNKPEEAPEIIGPYVELAQKLRYELGWDESTMPYQSAREAGRRTGLYYLTVLNVARGIRATYKTVFKIAQTYGWGMDETLRLAGLEPVPASPVNTDDKESIAEYVKKTFPHFNNAGQQEMVDTILRLSKK